MNNTDTNAIDICLEDLSFNDEPLEVRIVVLSKILKDLGITYKRYYTKKSTRSFRRVKRPDIIPEKDLTIVYTVNTDESHIQYATWLFNEQMKKIVSMYRMYHNSP